MERRRTRRCSPRYCRRRARVKRCGRRRGGSWHGGNWGVRGGAPGRRAWAKTRCSGLLLLAGDAGKQRQTSRSCSSKQGLIGGVNQRGGTAPASEITAVACADNRRTSAGHGNDEGLVEQEGSSPGLYWTGAGGRRRLDGVATGAEVRRKTEGKHKLVVVCGRAWGNYDHRDVQGVAADLLVAAGQREAAGGGGPMAMAWRGALGRLLADKEEEGKDPLPWGRR